MIYTGGVKFFRTKKLSKIPFWAVFGRFKVQQMKCVHKRIKESIKKLHFWPFFGRFWLFSTVFGPFLAVFGRFWPFLAVLTISDRFRLQQMKSLPNRKNIGKKNFFGRFHIQYCQRACLTPSLHGPLLWHNQCVSGKS